MASSYETVFIMTPVLSQDQLKEVVGKFRKILKDLGANILHEESWGQHETKKRTGHYQLFEYEAGSPSIVADLELAFKRDDRVLRFMTIRLDRKALRGEARTRLLEESVGQGSESGGDKQSAAPKQKAKNASKKGRKK